MRVALFPTASAVGIVSMTLAAVIAWQRAIPPDSLESAAALESAASSTGEPSREPAVFPPGVRFRPARQRVVPLAGALGPTLWAGQGIDWRGGASSGRRDSDPLILPTGTVGVITPETSLSLTIRRRIPALARALGDLRDVTLPRLVSWSLGSHRWEWNLDLPLWDYVEHALRPRPHSYTRWVELARDGRHGDYLDSLVARLAGAARENHLTDIDRLMLVVEFVRALPYRADLDTTGQAEYARYPVETLFEGGGDCEDKAILAVALLDRMGYDVALLILPEARHAAIGVDVADAGQPGRQVYRRRLSDVGGDTTYVYIETAETGWGIGQVPSSIRDAPETSLRPDALIRPDEGIRRALVFPAGDA